MPLRLYHHAGGMYCEDGKVVCQKCGAELDDNLLSPTDILAIIRMIEARGTYETAHRVLQICGD